MDIEVRRDSQGNRVSYLNEQEVVADREYTWDGNWKCPCCGGNDIDVNESYEEDDSYHWSCTCSDCDAEFTYWSDLRPATIYVETLGCVNPVDLYTKRYEDLCRRYDSSKLAGPWVPATADEEIKQTYVRNWENRLDSMEKQKEELLAQLERAKEEEGIARQQAWAHGEFKKERETTPTPSPAATVVPDIPAELLQQAEQQPSTVPEVSLGDMIRSAERGAGEVAARSLSEEQRRILAQSMLG